MKNYGPLYILSILFLFSILASCEKDDPVVVENNVEKITTLIYTLEEETTGEKVILSYRDPDGFAGNPPEITADNLTPNSSYNGTITVIDESAGTSNDITSEIISEGEDHQFFFQILDVDALIEYDDKDASDRPVGIKTKVQTNDFEQGILTVTLKHKPIKNNSTAQGQIAGSGGETDIEVSFPFVVR